MAWGKRIGTRSRTRFRKQSELSRRFACFYYVHTVHILYIRMHHTRALRVHNVCCVQWRAFIARLLCTIDIILRATRDERLDIYAKVHQQPGGFF